MLSINIHQAKTHLSELLARVCAGEEIIIAKAGHPIARLVPINNTQGERIPGLDKHTVVLTADFDDPLPEDIIEEFES